MDPQQPPHGQRPQQPWQPFPAPAQPWPPEPEPPRRRSSKRTWWIVGGSLAGVVVIALLAIVVVRSIQPQPLTAATPPVSGASTATTSAALPPPGAPIHCAQDDPGTTDCLPVTASALLTALPKLGYTCGPETDLKDNTACLKPKTLTNYEIAFETFRGGIDAVRVQGIVSGYVSELKQTQGDAWNFTVRAMNTVLPIVFPNSRAMRSAVDDWLLARHGDMTGTQNSNPLPLNYHIGCTDGSPLDVAGAHGVFRTYSYVCTVGVTPH